MHLILPIAISIFSGLAPAPKKPTPAPKKQDVNSTIARAQAAWGRVSTLRATFEQTVTNPLTGSAMLSKGELQQRKPSRLAITFSDPKGDRIVADGKFVWVYLQSATPGQVVKLANTDVGAASTDLIGQFLNTPRSRYDAVDAGADQVSGRSARAIVLTAKPGEQLPFIRAKVWVDAGDNLIRQFESTDASGITRRVRLLTLSPNATVDDKVFKFAVPKDVRVVER
jgi:outer membrane lipoprotein carrier protein